MFTFIRYCSSKEYHSRTKYIYACYMLESTFYLVTAVRIGALASNLMAVRLETNVGLAQKKKTAEQGPTCLPIAA